MPRKTIFPISSDIVSTHTSPLEIALWHQKTFPDTSLLGQLAKLKEEKQEWAHGHNIEELADCYIVTCGLLRFPSKDASIAFWWVEEQCLQWGIFSTDLLKAIDNKMKVNYNRVWKATNNGAYHHV